ncbi:hypothetical protein J1605_006979 [Eschrichtius robustus]|uniref:Uncharacterized protein n=1 Tax=Eschrichtius robustus TaxID=9764 RepID=A0AB34H251_ESCRO|nr:hypothetical protein J1605_006979 [Eschrichtius robustus]
MALKCKSSDAGNSNMPKGSCKVLPLSEKVKVLSLIREEKESYADVAKIYSKNKKIYVPSVILKEWSAYKGKSPQTPELVSALTFREWTCPNLKKLWLGKAVEDKNRRMRAFLACMKSDTPSMLNPANVPTHLLLMCCVLR